MSTRDGVPCPRWFKSAEIAGPGVTSAGHGCEANGTSCTSTSVMPRLAVSALIAARIAVHQFEVHQMIVAEEQRAD